MKKVFSMLTTVALILSLLCVSASATEGTIVATNEFGDNFTTLEEAISYTYETYAMGTVTVTDDYTLTESLNIPADIILVVPSSSALNDTLTGNNVSGGVTSGSAYVTLTVPTGKTLTVNGTLLVAGNQQSTQPKTGCLTGDFGKINLTGSLVVENGGKLYARGEISGSGEVIAKSGSTVYQMFQINDWRGGTATVAAYDEDNSVFPFNLYEIKNITATATYYKGSTLKGQYYVYARSTSVPGEEVVIGNGGQFEFENNADADDNVVMSYANGKTTVTLHGALKTGHITVTITIAIFNYTISSADLVCPVGYNMDVVIAGDGSMNISNEMKFLPGCNVTVKNGGTLTIEQGGKAYFYGASGYSSTYNYANWGPTTAATLTVETGGTVNKSGTIASTDAAFANVDGFTATETTVTVNEVTQSGSAVTLVPVTFYVGTPAASSVEE